MIFATISLGLALLPTAFATVHDIQVGATGLTFTPEAISAVPGDQVVFHFHAKNHTATQSSFANPCGLKDGGVNSGFMPVAANATDFPTFTVPINDTNPFWVYCAQAAGTANSHCGAGMVFAVNCGQDGQPNSFTNFKAAALAIGAELQAGATATDTGYSSGSPTSSAAAGSITIPPAPTGIDVTQTITLQQSTWTTSYTSFPGSPNPTPGSLTGNVITVVVGGSGLVFDPPRVAAQPRDTIVFEFHSKNHTVTQSSFANPCVQLAVNGAPGFDSGFMPVSTDATSFPTFNYTVNDTAPVWAFCRQANHCGSGMVFAINSVEDSARNYTAFKSLAQAINGSSSTSSSAPSSSSTSGASALTVGSASLTFMLGTVLAAIL
jgi:plastocyanin